jgi:transcriptional regulator with PAS, ATPase and Fis domain
LLDYFTQRFSRLSAKTMAIHESVYPWLSAYAWPGNVRELEHAVEQALALNSSGILTPQDFSEQTGQAACPTPPAPAWLTLAQKQLEYVRQVLSYTGQNISRAAEILKIDRKTLYRFLRKTENGK